MSLCDGCGCNTKEICIVQGDDYLAIDGRAICVSSVGCSWPENIASVSVVFDDVTGGCGCPGDSSEFKSLAVYKPGPPASVCFDLTSKVTWSMAAGKLRYNFSVIAKLVTGSEITLVTGRASVVARA
jgi:hypothetical protein